MASDLIALILLFGLKFQGSRMSSLQEFLNSNLMNGTSLSSPFVLSIASNIDVNLITFHDLLALRPFSGTERPRLRLYRNFHLMLNHREKRFIQTKQNIFLSI